MSSLTVCRCCGERITVASPRNPNLCAGCEQLLEDDCVKLDTLLANVRLVPQTEGRPAEPPKHPDDEIHSGGI